MHRATPVREGLEALTACVLGNGGVIEAALMKTTKGKVHADVDVHVYVHGNDSRAATSGAARVSTRPTRPSRSCPSLGSYLVTATRRIHVTS